jgi:hypothetical protein
MLWEAKAVGEDVLNGVSAGSGGVRQINIEWEEGAG